MVNWSLKKIARDEEKIKEEAHNFLNQRKIRAKKESR